MKNSQKVELDLRGITFHAFFLIHMPSEGGAVSEVPRQNDAGLRQVPCILFIFSSRLYRFPFCRIVIWCVGIDLPAGPCWDIRYIPAPDAGGRRASVERPLREHERPEIRHRCLVGTGFRPRGDVGNPPARAMMETLGPAQGSVIILLPTCLLASS